MKPKKSKHLTIQAMDETEILESYADKSYLHLEEVKGMDHQELTELLQFYELEDDIERYKKSYAYMKKAKEERIEVAPLPIRIWSYFYEKYILRIAAGIWLLIWASVIKPLVTYKLTGPWLDEMIAKSTNPMMRKSFDEGIPLHLILLVWGLVALWLGWRLFYSWSEAGKVARWGNSSYIRSRIRLVVVDRNGETIGFVKSFLRSTFRLFPLFFVSVITMQFNKNWRGLHDKIFGTYVLKIADDVSASEMKSFIATHYND